MSSGREQLLLFGLSSLVILGAWTLWKYCNRRVVHGVFDGGNILVLAGEELLFWRVAEA